MKRFMYFSIAVLSLSIAMFIGFQIGTRSAVAQTSSFTRMAISGPQLHVGKFNMYPCWDVVAEVTNQKSCRRSRRTGSEEMEALDRGSKVPFPE
jgi:hypothetical protein